MTWLHCQNNVTKHFESHSFCDGNNAPQDAEYSRRKSTKVCRSGSERF